MESPARYAKTNVIKEAASQSEMGFFSMETLGKSNRQTQKKRRVFFTGTLSNHSFHTQPSNILPSEHLHTHVSPGRRDGCRMKHLPATIRPQLQGFLLSSHSLSLYAALIWRVCWRTGRLCWIEERNYGASSPCRLLGWTQSVLHCQNKLMSQLVPAPSEIWQRARTTIRGLRLVKQVIAPLKTTACFTHPASCKCKHTNVDLTCPS